MYRRTRRTRVAVMFNPIWCAYCGRWVKPTTNGGCSEHS